MGKSRSGYKRRFTPEQPAGVKIEVRIAEAYQLLLECATASRYTIGRWAELQLTYALSGRPYIAKPIPFAERTVLPKPKSFIVGQPLFDAITLKVGEGKEIAWIANTLIFIAQIERRRLDAAAKEPDRFEF